MSVEGKASNCILVQAAELKALLSAIFKKAGCSAEESDRVAHYLCDGNLTGHDSHGAIRAGRYVQWIKEGRIVPDQHVKTLMETDILAIADGQYGLGQSIGPEAVRLGIDKASGHGVAVIALRNSGHLGRIGAWAEMAAEADLVSIHFVNVRSSLLVAPYGGVDRRMSSAPFVAGIPLQGDDPIILDFSTALVAEGKALVALKGGKPVPGDALITPDGTRTSDPKVLYGEPEPGRYPNPLNGPGALRAMGEHKGSGLAIICELMAGAFTGAGCAGPPPRAYANAMLSIYMKVDVFHSDGGFADEVRQYVDYVKSARPEIEGVGVMVPGEPERKARRDRLANGIPISADAWASILETAEQVGLESYETRQIVSV